MRNLPKISDIPNTVVNGSGLSEILKEAASHGSEGDTSEPQEVANNELSHKRKTSFVLEDDGLYFTSDDNKKSKISSPLNVIAETQTITGENYGRLVEWEDSKKRLHRWALPIELVHSDSNEHIKYLVSRGLEIRPNRFARQKLSEFIAESKPDKTAICTERIGWNDELFVLPDLTIGKMNESESVIFQSAKTIDHRFQTEGTLKEWQENIARFCVGNSRLVFAVSVAFASCLLTPLQEGGGGFHFRGASSLGKSTTLLVGGSVWGGDPRQGFLNTWRTTSNGLESVAEIHNDSLLCLDELKECDPRTASETAYMLANGQGKGRMNKSIFARKPLTWTLLFLSSGELSLSDIIEQNGGRVYGGQEVRFCDIPADAESGFGLFENLHIFPTAELFAKTLSMNSKRFYGVAVRKFLKKVSENLEHLRNRWQHFRQDFMKETLSENATGEVQRVAARFALVAFGGWLAREICGWNETESRNACQKLFITWLNNRSGSGNTDAENAIRNIRFFLEQHENSRFQDVNTMNPDVRILNRAGYKRLDDSSEIEFLVFNETFRKELCKGFDMKMVVNALADKGLLEKGHDRAAKQIKIEGKNSRFFVIKSKIFESE